MIVDPRRVLFVGYGRSVVSWYRCALPGLYLGADWVNVDDFCNKATGQHIQPWGQFDYDVVIWQQPRTQAHHDVIQKLRAKGIKVLVEVDDYLHGVRRMKDHDFAPKKRQVVHQKGFRPGHAPGEQKQAKPKKKYDDNPFTLKELRKFERAMSMSDGIICSTQFLADRYGKFAPRAWVCKNGLDLGRYQKSRPKHSTVNIGWAGATGHAMSFDNIRAVVGDMLRNHDLTTFISIGQGFAAEWAQEFGNRIMALPFTSLEVYPNAMCLFDISLAPARDTDWYRGKSALRYYEAAALGIPTVGSEVVYSEIEDGVTGFVVDDSAESWHHAIEKLILNDDLRLEMGRNAHMKALTEFDMNVRKQQWIDVIEEVAAA